MYIHAYDNELNYLGIKDVKKATIAVKNNFEKELLVKYPKATINFDIEPTEIELKQQPCDDLPF